MAKRTVLSKYTIKDDTFTSNVLIWIWLFKGQQEISHLIMFTPVEFLPHCRSLLCITVLIYISLEFKKVGIDQTVVPQVLLPMCMKTLTARWLIPWSYRISGACSQMLPVWKSKPNGKLFHRNY